MVSTTARHASGRPLVALAALTATLLLSAPAIGQEARGAGSVSALSRVRAGDTSAASLLRNGMARSATIRAIVETLEASDLIVYIETRPIRLPGQLQLVAATPGCRHVRVSIRTPGLDTEQVAWLGHELWHAVELAGAPDVRDQEALLRFYRRIGSAGTSGQMAETARAQEVWTTVLYEARAAGRTSLSAR